MYDVPSLLPCSPQPTRSEASSTPTRQSPLRLSSPSKIRATPSKTRHASPRKSPAKSRTFHAMSTQSVSFTPEKTRQPPRAWERRPATPFIPRDDKQKIWKRVPLGEIGIEPNRPMNISRREQEATRDYVRVVKKLKVGHGSDDEDKENVSASAKTDVEGKDPRRRVRFDTRFVNMKTEEDTIVGSPKKKLRTVLDGCNPPVEEDVSEEHEREDAEEDTRSVEEGGALRAENQVTGKECGGQDLATEMTDSVIREHSDNDEDPALEEEIPDASCREILVADAHRPGDVADNTPSGHESDVQSVIVQMEVTREQVSNTFEHGNPEHADLNDQRLPAQYMEVDYPMDTSNQPNNTMEDNAAESPRPVSEEPQSSSPPTVLAENVIIDELESRNVSKLDAPSADQCSSSDNEGEAQEPEDTTAQDPIPRRTSDDEATFLRKFIATSKAERAAREKKIQETHSDESNDEQGETSRPQAKLYETAEELACAVEEIPILEPPAEASVENISSSPLRRSKRAVITSIPRPQALPNAIQLKRANGNEFIFTANKASSTVNVAVVTRSNTKRNKGSALNVPERLEQLLADEKGVANTEPAQAVGDVAETSGKLAVEKADDKTESKKRKRDAKDGARAKKVLRWNDEKLVSYQEAEKNIDGWEDIDDSSQENSTSHDHETGSTDKHVKLTLTMASNGGSGTQNLVSARESSASSKSATKDQKEASTSNHNPSQNKLRRVRRGTSGTVNGTPGPKTRSRRVADSEERDSGMDVPVDMNGSVEDSTAAVVAISSLAATTDASKSVGSSSVATGKKSRMPVPVPMATGLGARRGAAASASVRGASTMGRAGVVAAGTGVDSNEARKVKETSKSQSQTAGSKGDGKGDLLGKRRLRVRP